MNKPVRGYWITEEKDASKGFISAGRWEDAACRDMAPNWNPEREIVTILPHSGDKVGEFDLQMAKDLANVARILASEGLGEEGAYATKIAAAIAGLFEGDRS